MRKLLFAVGLGLTTPLLFAQSKPPAEPGFVSAQMIITIESRHDHDRNVPSINREDVLAYERKEPIRVTDLVPLCGDEARLDLFLLLDDASNTGLGSQLGDLRRFIGAQPPATAIGIGYMRNGTVDVVQNLTSDHEQAAHRLRLPLSSGGVSPSPYLSLSDLIKRWPPSSARREVIMVTSGVDPLGGFGPTNPYLDSAIGDAQRSGVVVYAIYMPAAGHAGHSFFRMNWGQNYLAQLAEETGGEAYMLGFGPPVSFEPYLDEITAHLAHQYRAQLAMKPGNKGSLRNVRLTTEVPNAEIVAAARVYVPAASRREDERNKKGIY